MNKDKKIEYKGSKTMSDLVIQTTNQKLFFSLQLDEYVFGVEHIEKSQVIFCLSKKYLLEYENNKLKGILSEEFQIKDGYIKLYANDLNDLKTKIFEEEFSFSKGNYELHKITKDNINYGVLIKPAIVQNKNNISSNSNYVGSSKSSSNGGVLDLAGDLIEAIIDGIFSS